jgi:hypothetical protein
MHMDLNWQRTLDRQTRLRVEARQWRQQVRHPQTAVAIEQETARP